MKSAREGSLKKAGIFLRIIKREELKRMPSPKPKQVILGVCGSIAAYKAGDIIRRLRDDHCEVTVIMTKEAEQFITPLTLSTLSGKNVYGDMFDRDSWRMSHIELARAAE